MAFEQDNNKDEATFVPCTYEDYCQATENQIPERWLNRYKRMNKEN